MGAQQAEAKQVIPHPLITTTLPAFIGGIFLH
uniref:Transporter n=1 Tax=Heterorhabditis bacteriophora TaxID=37862 RepID=A0A1I7X7R8_HETBA